MDYCKIDKKLYIFVALLVITFNGCGYTIKTVSDDPFKIEKPILNGNLLFANVVVAKEVSHLWYSSSSESKEKRDPMVKGNISPFIKGIIQDSIIASVKESNFFNNNELINYFIIASIKKLEFYTLSANELKLWIDYSLVNMKDNKIILKTLIKSHVELDEFIFSGYVRHSKTIQKAVLDNTNQLIMEIYNKMQFTGSQDGRLFEHTISGIRKDMKKVNILPI